MYSFYHSKPLVLVALVVALASSIPANATHSVAMQWNEVQLNCIRKDFARPAIQARNLCHASVLMYDCWAAFDDDASTYFLGKTWGPYTCPYNGIQIPANTQAAQEKAISYAMYRFLNTRYSTTVPPANLATIQGYINGLMATLGYDTSITSTDYSDGDPAKLGNYIASQLQNFALVDGSNQQNNYANQYYQPVNGDLHPQLPGNPLQEDGNRWQRLSLVLSVDQGGNPIPNGGPALTPEWGNVVPFSLTPDDMDTYQRDGHDWNVYHDPGPPPLLDTVNQTGFDDSFFKWGYCINSIWHSFHTISDGVTLDISPAHIGNVDASNLPDTFEEYKDFYDEFNGGDPGTGYTVNPATGLPYVPQIVNRGDYTRVLSEFWADGPASETPPGHWFTILNYVANHPAFEKRWEGTGPILPDLEWDVRSYFALGGGIHDAAIACWGAKGWYDYTRPIMAIRYMADRGQSSDPNLPGYHPGGLPLIPGYIEQVQIGDPLAGANNENVNKVKLYTWMGPQTATGLTGVGWILAENWWTYQKSTFVTPPFQGYYSGHSTYSRTGAEILTRITGDAYFPGGMGEFIANPGFLGADSGPSAQIKLQWAKYSDASDQCSLSRIYGGLHPPQDDIPGRKVGLIIGPEAYAEASDFINAGIPHIASIAVSDAAVTCGDAGDVLSWVATFTEPMNTGVTPTIQFINDNPVGTSLTPTTSGWTSSTQYSFNYIVEVNPNLWTNVVVKVTGAQDLSGNANVPAISGVSSVQAYSCAGDYNCDYTHNVTDLLLFMTDFGCTVGCMADLNGDIAVNVTDLLLFVSLFGNTCN